MELVVGVGDWVGVSGGEKDRQPTGDVSFPFP